MKKNKKPGLYYYVFGAQVAIIILASIFLGNQLDKIFKTTNAPFMVAAQITPQMLYLMLHGRKSGPSRRKLSTQR